MLLLEKSKLEIKEVKPSKEVELVECKLVIKFNGKQFTFTTSERKNKKPELENTLYALLEDYLEFFYLVNYTSHLHRYEDLTQEEIREYYNHCKFVKEGLERVYGVVNLKQLINYFQVEV